MKIYYMNKSKCKDITFQVLIPLVFLIIIGVPICIISLNPVMASNYRIAVEMQKFIPIVY